MKAAVMQNTILMLYTASIAEKNYKLRGKRTEFFSKFYRNQFLKSQYTDDLAEYNKTHGTDYAQWEDVHLTRRVPEGTELERQDWLDRR